MCKSNEASINHCLMHQVLLIFTVSSVLIMNN